MGAIASQITSLTIVYPIVYSYVNQRKHQSSASLAFVGEFTGDRWLPVTRKMFPIAGNSPVTGEFPTQMASNAENVSIDDVIMEYRSK